MREEFYKIKEDYESAIAKYVEKVNEEKQVQKNCAMRLEKIPLEDQVTGAEKLYTSGQKSKTGWIISGLFMAGNGVTMLVLPMIPKCVDAEFAGCKGF